MKNNILYLILVMAALVVACDNDYFPEGYYAYQVEYMLTNGDTATWTVTSWEENGEDLELSTCTDSVWFWFGVVDTDSIAAYQLKRQSDCILYDSTFLGQLIASGDDAYFTDSLNLKQTNESINTMMVTSLTSSKLAVEFAKNGNKNVVELEKQ